MISRAEVPSSSDLQARSNYSRCLFRAQGPLGRLCHLRHVDTDSMASHTCDGPRDQGEILGGVKTTLFCFKRLISLSLDDILMIFFSFYYDYILHIKSFPHISVWASAFLVVIPLLLLVLLRPPSSSVTPLTLTPLTLTSLLTLLLTSLSHTYTSHASVALLVPASTCSSWAAGERARGALRVPGPALCGG